MTEIKNTMGKTLINAFAHMHMHQPADPRAFLANYLINIQKNEQLIKEKMQMFYPTNEC